MNWIKDTKLFLFDMDGTLYRGGELFPYTIPLLQAIKVAGKRYMFMTNNSSRSVAEYIRRLAGMGIAAAHEEFITASQATALFLQETCPREKLFVCGTRSFKEELTGYGLTVTEDVDEADSIVMASDPELTFQKLEAVCRRLTLGNPRYVATNPDSTIPTEYGSVPDCGSICDMVFNATGKRPLVIGKPQPAMPRIAMEWMGCTPAETAVIGDRLDTDILSGQNAGCRAVLVLTGDTRETELAAGAIQPDVVLDSVKEILQVLKR